VIRYPFPLDAEYTIKVLLRRQEYDYLIGMGEPHQLDIRLDGSLLKRFTVGGEAKGPTTPENFAGNTQRGHEYEAYMHSAAAAAEEPCAKKILTTLATRAYRRPLTEADVQTLLSFYRSGRTDRSFDTGIQQGIERMLAAPSFLFRIEREPASLAAGSAYRLND